MPDASSQSSWLKRSRRALVMTCAIIPATLCAEDSAELLRSMEPGSVIKDLLVPQHNEQRLATVVLRVDKVTVLTESLIRAENTSLHLIRNESAKRTGPTMLRINDATYNLNSGILDSTALCGLPLCFDMQGDGIVTRLQRKQTEHQLFLRPPVIGYIHPKEINIEPAMNTPRPLAAALIAAFAANAQEATRPAPDVSLLTMTPRNETAEKALLDFAKEHNIPLNAVTPPPLPPAALAPVDPAQQAPEFKPGPDAIGFACKGGVFYNSQTATLTFLDQTTVRDPAYAMTVNGKVIVTFAPNNTKDDKKDKSNSLGDVSSIQGSGGTAFEATDKEGVKNFAFGDSVDYDAQKKTATLRGNRLVFQKGNNQRFESANPNAWLTYDLEKKDFAMSDGWRAIIVIPPDDKKKQP